jgi:hypothetical protein
MWTWCRVRRPGRQTHPPRRWRAARVRRSQLALREEPAAPLQGPRNGQRHRPSLGLRCRQAASGRGELDAVTLARSARGWAEPENACPTGCAVRRVWRTGCAFGFPESYHVRSQRVFLTPNTPASLRFSQQLHPEIGR